MNRPYIYCFSWNRYFTASVLCADKKSNTKRDLRLLSQPERFVQMFSIHQVISFSFIQPWGLGRIIPPSGNSSHGTFLSLKIMTGGSFVPSAKQTKITVKFE